MHKDRTTYPKRKALLYQQLQELPKKYKVLALVRMEKVRSSQLLPLRKKFKDEVLKKEIVEIMESNPAYGYRRVAIALRLNGKKVLRIMRNNGLKPKIFRRKWTKKQDIGLPIAVYDNHLKNLEVNNHNIAWAADFTLATVIDIYGQEIVGLAVSDRHNRHLVKATAIDAIKKSKPASSKGTYIKTLGFNATMGPSIKLQTA